MNSETVEVSKYVYILGVVAFGLLISVVLITTGFKTARALTRLHFRVSWSCILGHKPYYYKTWPAYDGVCTPPARPPRAEWFCLRCNKHGTKNLPEHHDWMVTYGKILPVLQGEELPWEEQQRRRHG